MNRKTIKTEGSHKSNSGNSTSKRGRTKRAHNGDIDDSDNTSHLADPPDEVNLREVLPSKAVPNVKQHDLAPPRGGTVLDLDAELTTAQFNACLENSNHIRCEDQVEHKSNYIIVPSYASWFDDKVIHIMERRAMPEFFNIMNPFCQETYMTTRNSIIDTYRLKPTEYLDIKTCSRNFSGNINAIVRIHAFLEHWGLINHQVEHETGIAQMGPPPTNHFHLLAETSSSFKPVGSDGKINTRQSNRTNSSYIYNPRIREEIELAKGREFPEEERGLRDSDFGLRLDDYFIHNLNFQTRGAAKLTRDWNETETLALLEAIELYKDDWQKVCKHVGCRTQDECILHFLRLPIEDPFLIEDEAPTLTSGVDQYQPMPFSKSGNPIMSTIAFLASVVDPSVAASAARAALQEFSKLAEADPSKEKSIDDNYLSSAASCALIAAACKAKHLASIEERKIKSLVSVLIDTQLKKLGAKLKHLEELDTVVDKERNITDNQRKQLIKEQQEFQEEQVRAEKFRAEKSKIENMINPDS